MINTIIFDFGDVFINLDKEGAMQNALNLFGLEAFEDGMLAINKSYEVGEISTSTFVTIYKAKFPHLSESEIISAWNYIIKDFPIYRFEFIKHLSEEKKYRLILLSNTNDLHIDFIKTNVSFYNEFKACFDIFYLSHEINLRKPNSEIFEFVLKENNIKADECIFIDDTKENTDMADKIGFSTWNIDETKEDIVNLFQLKKDLF